ncbi:galactose-1-phosphate uridylyltransferase [Polychytrium aggregatum]|uniref:galactose-1-phosphate uridylyltransferase n=1 Tax=Polychytrium aggregatum TaxID=110093 RepID=UPI0022FE9243|nr:galactose-1-phosphate uridylyltransferase [Polychytrium aggregatum]KAI9208913.1 galactose-1-phosphate uridylyltransferase [Polychytrium aggregatum]
MASSFFENNPHRRWNPLTDSWVLCSPHRAKRPWLGQQESPQKSISTSYVSDCYLCPRNTRSNGESKNPAYEATFVFDNDFAAVSESYVSADAVFAPGQSREGDSVEPAPDHSLVLAERLLRAKPVRGKCRVVCFSPQHNLTLAEMDQSAVENIIRAWILEYETLGHFDYINYVQIFENKGAIMGCSNPHPHGQIWATESIPEEPSKELRSLAQYRSQHGSCLLCDYVGLEQTDGARTVAENDSFICVVPYWAVWPFEILVMAKTHLVSIVQLSDKQQTDMADILRRMACRYDNLFQCSFPYSMGIHQAPTDGKDHSDDCHLHIHFYPPLLRNANIKKFLVGYEMLAEPQRDLTSEQACQRLKACSEVHFSRAEKELRDQAPLPS